MPTTNTEKVNAMGFLGLQTKKNNTVDKISSKAKESLFDQYGQNNISDDYTGSLYQFGSTRQALIDRAKEDLGIGTTKTPSIDVINKYVDFIDKQTNNLLITKGIKGQIDDEPDYKKKANILIESFGAEASVLPDACFVGANKENTNRCSYELK
jgi:hypothetical protein